MSRFWNRRTAGLEPYVPGEQSASPNLVKLNTNEHSEQPSAAAMAALAATSGDALRRYPEPTAVGLRRAIAELEGLDETQVHCGNGSDEVLAQAFLAFFDQETPVTVPDITYSFYPVWAELAGTRLATLPLRDDFTIDLNALQRCDGPLLFANPNAPTGLAIGREQLRDVLSSNRHRLVIVDEAYYGFGAETAAPLIAEFDNLLVTRTLSKSHALAGLRVGYALGDTSLIEGLIRVKDSFNSYPLDAVAQEVAEAAIRDSDWFETASQRVMVQRDALQRELSRLGFRVLPSAANFVFAAHGDTPGADIFAALREREILIRRWDRPRIDNWLRITVGTEAENARLIDALADILSQA
jgi:histidinol-phosphate aminotransferase